ncbi:MAG: hypothetical protein GX628_00620 [Clostridiales bacterium]|mgnify:FL=1|nr:hypothetical protein [Clostridiales bacterium]
MKIREIFNRYPASFPLPLLLDGAHGTELIKRGMPRGTATMVWAAKNPDKISDALNAYRCAGADVIYTPTFGGTKPMLAKSGVEDDEGLNRALARLAFGESSCERGCKNGAAAGRGWLVGGGLSPTGLFIEPWGDTPFEDVVAVYARQAKVLAEEGADFMVTETNISMYETKAAVIGSREGVAAAGRGDIPMFVTMTVDERGRTLSGETLLSCLVTFAGLGVAAFGANCSTGPDIMAGQLLPLVPYSRAFGIPLIAKPNAGLPREDEKGTHFDMGPEEFAAFAVHMLEGGIFILGGCCGSGPEHTAALREVIDRSGIHDDYDAEDIALPSVERLASTGGNVCEIPADAVFVEYDGDTSLEDICGDGDYAAISLPDLSAAEALAEYDLTFPKPIALTGDADAVALAARRWNGHALVVG